MCEHCIWKRLLVVSFVVIQLSGHIAQVRGRGGLEWSMPVSWHLTSKRCTSSGVSFDVQDHIVVEVCYSSVRLVAPKRTCQSHDTAIRHTRTETCPPEAVTHFSSSEHPSSMCSQLPMSSKASFPVREHCTSNISLRVFADSRSNW